jgi:hypothetical protein
MVKCRKSSEDEIEVIRCCGTGGLRKNGSIYRARETEDILDSELVGAGRVTAQQWLIVSTSSSNANLV